MCEMMSEDLLSRSVRKRLMHSIQSGRLPFIAAEKSALKEIYNNLRVSCASRCRYLATLSASWMSKRT